MTTATETSVVTWHQLDGTPVKYRLQGELKAEGPDNDGRYKASHYTIGEFGTINWVEVPGTHATREQATAAALEQYLATFENVRVLAPLPRPCPACGEHGCFKACLHDEFAA